MRTSRSIPDIRDVFRLRARAVSYIRRRLDALGFLEVETPVLQPLYGGAAARPFVTHHNALDMPLYLRIADELYLKRLLVGGLERVYEIGHDFRNEGMDRTHNPEFTMLELYQAYADYGDMMDLTESLVVGVLDETLGTRVIERYGTTLDFSKPFARVRFIEARRGPVRARPAHRVGERDALRPSVAWRRGGSSGGAQRRPAAGRGLQDGSRAGADPADIRPGLSARPESARQGPPQPIRL